MDQAVSSGEPVKDKAAGEPTGSTKIDLTTRHHADKLSDEHLASTAAKPWEDRSLSHDQRLAAYSGYIARTLTERNAVLDGLPESESAPLRALEDYRWLLRESQAILSGELTPTTFCIRMDTLAQVILDSFHIDKEGFHHLTIPAGVSDIEALKAMNRYFAEKNPDFMARLKMNALYEENLPWLQQLGGARDRDISQPRIVEIIPLVEGTVNSSCYDQIQLFEKLGLDFVPEIEQALVGLAFACLGEAWIGGTPGNPFPRMPDVFKDKFARGASMLSGMWYDPRCGIALDSVPDYANIICGASGKKIKVVPN